MKYIGSKLWIRSSAWGFFVIEMLAIDLKISLLVSSCSETVVARLNLTFEYGAGSCSKWVSSESLIMTFMRF